MAAHNSITLGNDEFSTFLGPVPPGAPNFRQIDFTATDPSHPGTVALGEPGSPLDSPVADHPSLVWALPSLVAHGKPGQEVYGSVQLEQPLSGTVKLQQGVNLSHGNLGLGTNEGGAFTLSGASTVTNGSTLTALGGRYASLGLGNYAYNVNGSLSVTHNSVADFDRGHLAGTGTIHIGSGSTVDAKTIVAGLHVHVDNGGTMSLLRPNSAGTITEAAGGHVLIGGATTATHEIFHKATGTLDLINKAGTQVAELQFAPGSREYTHAASGGLMDITTSAAHALPTIFTH